MTFTVVLFSLLLFLLGLGFLRTRVRSSRLVRLNWDELAEQLQPVRIADITRIAVDYLEPQKDQLGLPMENLWRMIGEEDGLRRMYANAQVLIALATYAQRWNRRESLIVAERMRRDGIILRRAAFCLSLNLATGYDRVRGPFCVQEAASAYYLMRTRLLALYASCHAGRLPKLASIL